MFQHWFDLQMLPHTLNMLWSCSGVSVYIGLMVNQYILVF